MSAESVEVLPALLSLDLTAGLVKQGVRAPWSAGEEPGDTPITTLDVLDASNTTPIVITVALGGLSAIAPKEGRLLHVVIAGVTGNTAANKVDPRTLRNEAWVAIVTSSEDATTTTLALYELSGSTGGLVPSVGNGAYAGGGTVSKALVDGRILVGREHIGESSAAPRVVFVPLRLAFGPRDDASSWTADAMSEGETDREELNRTIASERITYEVHAWGKAATSLSSFTATARIVHQVIRSAHLRCAGVYEPGNGDWLDQHEGAPQRLKYGHEVVFSLTLAAPIDDGESAAFAQGEISIEAAMLLQLNGGTPEAI
jgi:hypothetical protein